MDVVQFVPQEAHYYVDAINRLPLHDTELGLHYAPVDSTLLPV